MSPAGDLVDDAAMLDHEETLAGFYFVTPAKAGAYRRGSP
jgi:hypothetical protein